LTGRNLKQTRVRHRASRRPPVTWPRIGRPPAARLTGRTGPCSRRP